MVSGPINFFNLPDSNQFQIRDANGAVIRTGTRANNATEVILGSLANTNCWFSDWDTSGNTGNGDQSDLHDQNRGLSRQSVGLSDRDQLRAPLACRQHLQFVTVPLDYVPFFGNPAKQIRDQAAKPGGLRIWG